MKSLLLVSFFIGILSFSACSEEGETSLGVVANAGENQEVQAVSLVTLDGSKSSGSDEIFYKWAISEKPSTSSSSLSNPNSVNPTFVADKDGNYTVLLQVYSTQPSESELDKNITLSVDSSLVDSVVIVATSMPVANAGIDQNVFTTSTVYLDGSASSDANGDPLSYTWSIVSKPTGSNATLSNTKEVKPYFIADLSGTYRFSLIVSDGENSSSADEVVITSSIENIKPVANAGTDKTNVKTGTTITLDGSLSSDANTGDTLSYLWSITSRPNESNNTLSDTNISTPTFLTDANGSFVFSLVVSDGTLNSEADTVSVMTIPNIAPVANAGSDIDLNSSIGALKVSTSLNGSGTDSHNDALTYLWSIPVSSDANLTGVTTATPTFEANTTAIYTVSLVVNDGEFNSSVDTIDINVTMN